MTKHIQIQKDMAFKLNEFFASVCDQFSFGNDPADHPDLNKLKTYVESKVPSSPLSFHKAVCFMFSFLYLYSFCVQININHSTCQTIIQFALKHNIYYDREKN